MQTVWRFRFQIMDWKAPRDYQVTYQKTVAWLIILIALVHAKLKWYCSLKPQCFGLHLWNICEYLFLRIHSKSILWRYFVVLQLENLWANSLPPHRIPNKRIKDSKCCGSFRISAGEDINVQPLAEWTMAITISQVPSTKRSVKTLGIWHLNITSPDLGTRSLATCKSALKRGHITRHVTM